MPRGFCALARRTRGARRSAIAAALAAVLTFVVVVPTAAASVPESPTAAPASTYPAPGQPVTSPAPDNGGEATIAEKDEQDLRVATLHADLTTEAESGDKADQLASALGTGNHMQSRVIARTVQLNRPDVLVLTGVTYDSAEQIAEQLRSQYLALGQDGLSGLDYPHMFTAPTNSGQDSGADLDGDGIIGGPGDAIGYGDYAGQYGMIVFSKHPIVEDEVRTFQNFLWRDLPEDSMPEGFSELEESILRLQESTLWDVPIQAPGQDAPVHVIATSLAAQQPTDTEVARAEDIRRVIADYVSGSAWYLSDDSGQSGGLEFGAQAVVTGSPLVIAPSTGQDLDALLDASGLQDPQPEAVSELPIAERPGDADQTDETATRYVDNGTDRRTSVVLPSANLSVNDSGVFWPGEGEYGYRVVDPESANSLQDRLVWVDLTTGD